MALAETIQTSVASEQLVRAKEQLSYHNVARLAVLGGTAAEELAKELGVREIDVHDSYASVLAASKEKKVGSVIPWQTAEGEPIYHDESQKTKNIEAILKAGRAMIASVEQPVSDSVLLTKIVIAA
jgi:ABC-type Fe3+-hydroxamate transport system substrate-binding protein